MLSTLVSIAPVSAGLSHQAQLVATSASGVRIFLRTTPLHGSDLAKLRPDDLRPLFTLAPPHAASRRCSRGSVLNSADVLLLASADEQQG